MQAEPAARPGSEREEKRFHDRNYSGSERR